MEQPAEQVLAARRYLKSVWDNMGDCASCGWHAMLEEHCVEDSDIEDALNSDNKMLYLSCLSKNDEDSYSHRGIKICLRLD